MLTDTKEYFVCSVVVHYCIHKSCASKDELVGGAYTHSLFSLSTQNEELKNSVKCLERELAKSKRGIVNKESSDV